MSPAPPPLVGLMSSTLQLAKLMMTEGRSLASWSTAVGRRFSLRTNGPSPLARVSSNEGMHLFSTTGSSRAFAMRTIPISWMWSPTLSLRSRVLSDQIAGVVDFQRSHCCGESYRRARLARGPVSSRSPILTGCFFSSSAPRPLRFFSSFAAPRPLSCSSCLFSRLLFSALPCHDLRLLSPYPICYHSQDWGRFACSVHSLRLL